MSEVTNDMQTAIHETAARLLKEGRVNMVVGYGRTPSSGAAPIFVRSAEDVEQLVWNSQCVFNLATYLSREPIKKHFPVGIVVKGCDRRAINMLLKEHVISREDVVLIGVPCSGVGEPVLKKCLHCEVKVPVDVDETIQGTPAEAAAPSEGRYADVETIEAMSPEARWDYWSAHFDRCIRCYACRQVCPMCYCKRCIAEKSEPQWIETSPHRRGNFAWNAIRAFHLTGRCVGCGECERVCPAGIPLGQINGEMGKQVEQRYDYRAGADAETRTPFTTYDLESDNDEGIL
jgi:formate dehydrogenase subunit beta